LSEPSIHHIDCSKMPVATPTSLIQSTALALGDLISVVTPTTTPAAVFTPSPSCNQGHLSMLGVYQNQVWLNYPYPALSLTETDCYPTSLLASLQTPFALPLSTLDIPNWYTVATTYASNYFVACPL
jgi:hypothetical protein